MRFRQKDIGKIAQEVLDFFGEHNIVHPSSFSEMLGHEYRHDKGKVIQVELSSSDLQTRAINLSYNIEGHGTPLCIYLNVPLLYYQIILKSVDSIKGFNPFGEKFFPENQDPAGNIRQYKRVKSIEISDLKADLERLVQ